MVPQIELQNKAQSITVEECEPVLWCRETIMLFAFACLRTFALLPSKQSEKLEIPL